MSTKQEVLVDESKFQRACSEFLNGKILYCVSSLMYDIGKNLEAASNIFDFDYDDAVGWFMTPPDLEEALCQNSIRVFEVDGTWYWSDEGNLTWDKVDELIAEFNEGVQELGEDGETVLNPEDLKHRTDFNTIEEALVFLNDHVVIRNFESMLSPDSEEEAMREACEGNRIDVDEYRSEVYEHWLVDSYFGSMLRERGETVFEFANMVIWGRQCSGQSISMDGVIRNMVRDLGADHYIWSRV